MDNLNTSTEEQQTNRAGRRKRTRLRLTKPVRTIRKRKWYGNTDVTFPIKHNIPIQHWIRVIKMGLNINSLTKLGKELSDGHAANKLS